MDAVIALIGVTVGALLTGTVDYFIQQRRSADATRREREAQTELARAAALVAAMELAEQESSLLHGEAKTGALPRQASIWIQRRELLAQQLGPIHAFPVTFVFSLVDRARELEGREREANIKAARELFDFVRVEILLAFATGQTLPPEGKVDAALMAAGSPPITRLLRTG
jgi:hypothetical protein